MNNRFAIGSGCFQCRNCERKTRKTGDGAGLQLCELCYDLAGLENEMSDCGATPQPEAEAEAIRVKIVSKGGNRKNVYDFWYRR